ncbi:adhesion G-protein coupled receptor G2 isoform X2 [Hippoglossus stenolepis]|uniref:adhesion G-protein coupled receptor G2 isoform X2 n=1 Tax=Hippoglossus stenolepis TaxID=195615 RepID=UPI00159C162E|nr:adhesion G-protein coupled receptor G2 isoform X2 [Hippoglossus stenolepis]
MVPLLLILLLPNSLADQVCINITSVYNMGITITNAAIVDNRSSNVQCKVGADAGADADACIFQCTFNTTSFNGSSACFEATVTEYPFKVDYIIQQYSNCALYLCTESDIVPLIFTLNTNSSCQKDMMQLLSIKGCCPKLFYNNAEVKKTFLTVEKHIIHNIIRATQFETAGSILHDLTAFSLDVLNISAANLSSSGTSWIRLQPPQLLYQNESFVPEILIPVDCLQSIQDEERIIGLVTYLQQDSFRLEQENISSMVLRIELLGGRRLYNLPLPIKMTFRVATDTNDTLLCHYLDEHDWLWKTDGCQTYSNQSDIICSCNHATAFAVLLTRSKLAEVHWKILSYISYIGCGLSAFFTALSILWYVFSRNHKMDFSISIHVSLSGALFLLNTTFLLTEWGATVELDWVCVFVAAFMHYSLLCCFTWMAIEALHLYLMLIKVFNTHYKHYLVKLSLVGWGIPGVIVAVSVAVKDVKQFYGATQMSMADTNQTNAICWITDNSFFYSLNLVYFTLIFIFNSGILITVASRICKMQQRLSSSSKLGTKTGGNAGRDPDNCKSGFTVMGLTCLLGTTWGLAFLGSGYVNYPILYLFCILNSTQGFFIFLWICLSAKKQRKQEMEDKMTTVNTSGIKSD